MRVEFNEENKEDFRSKNIFGRAENSKVANFLLKRGVVKDKKTAQYLLISIFIFCTISAILIPAIVSFGRQKSLKAQDFKELPRDVQIMLTK